MNRLDRRQFLRNSAAALGAASTLSLLCPAILRALAVPAKVETGTIDDVAHVVILMQENRSFDHYFGTLRGVRGFGDRFPIPLESGKPVWFQSDGTTEIPPYRLDSTTMSGLLVPDTPHTFADTQAAWNQGKFGFWPGFKTPYSMGHYQRDDIPFQFALAEAFTICDAYHCSVASGTDPNRIALFSGSNFNPELRAAGINCTDADSEPNNQRCWVSGEMPSPGYRYSGSAFQWPTLPDLLERAGVSWRIYQDPNDNWTGAMHGGLAFESFRQATAASGSPLYENGMSHWSLDDLRNHVKQGTLPAVSWILPSRAESEHPAAGSSPLHGGAFTAAVLEALTADSAGWSKTVLFLMFDENDGYFDHVPAPAVPSYNADGTLAGKSTVPLDGEYFSDPDGKYRLAEDTISGSLRPWGLGPRVPMYVISPWSKGGWVNSQVFDHSSVGMFLEKRFGISVDSISPWHRAVCGDLTSCFDFRTPNDPTTPTLPSMQNYASVEAVQRSLPPPLPPSPAKPLYQESGTRASRALPYELHTSARLDPAGVVRLHFSNSGSQGAVFHVYDKLHLDRIPRRYTIEAAKRESDAWQTTADAGAYDLWVYGPNGFVRQFAGNAATQLAGAFQPELQICYEPCGARLHVNVHNGGTQGGIVNLVAAAYRNDGPWSLSVAARQTATMMFDLGATAGWYDFTVTAASFQRRIAGRLETGAASVSDPAMARGLGAATAGG